MTAVVVFKNVEDGNLRSILFKLEDTVSFIRQKWSEVTGCNVSHFSFKVGDEDLPEDGLVKDMPLIAGSCLKISVEKITSHSIVIKGCPDMKLTLDIDPTSLVANVSSAICEELKIEQRPMELMIDDQKLSHEEALEEQGLKPAEVLYVEIPVKIEMKNIQTKEIRTVSCVASDDVGLLYDEDLPRSSQRLFMNGELIASTGSVGEAIKVYDNLNKLVWSLDIELAFPICVRHFDVKDGLPVISQRQVFPRQLVRDICTDENHEIMYSGQVIGRLQTFLELQVFSDALLEVGHFSKISVINSSGTRYGLNVDWNQTVSELKSAVRMFECTDDFHLTLYKTVLLPETRRLFSFGVINGSVLRMVRNGKLIFINHEGSEYSLGWMEDSSSVEDILVRCNKLSDLKLPVDTVFECSCGRKMFVGSSRIYHQGLCFCNNNRLKLTANRPVDLRIHFSIEKIVFMRLPTSTIVSEVIMNVNKLCDFNGPAYLKFANERLADTRPLHQIKIDTIVELELIRKIDFFIETGSQRQLRPCSAWPDEPLLDILGYLQAQNICVNPKDLAVFGGRNLNISDESNGRKRTLQDYGIPNGTILKIIECA